jgi:uncharacterized Zn finger protein
VNFEESGRATWTVSRNLLCTCTHSRLLSDCVTEEEQEAGQVRCVECGSVIPDPHLQRDSKGP